MSVPLLEIAIQKHRQGLLEEADGLYRQILSVNPRHLDALRLMSMLAEQRGDREGAVDYARQAVRLAPGVAALHLTLAGPLLSGGWVEEAIAAAREALRLDRKNIDAMLFLGDACQQKKDYMAALDWYRQAERLDRNIPELHNNRGNARMALGETDEAIACYRKALALNSHYADACFNLGNAYRARGEYEVALTAYQDALDREPAFYRAIVMLGVVSRHLGRIEDAERFYRRALDAMPPDAPEWALTWYNLGNLYLGLKDYDQAIGCYRHALERTPDDVAVLQNLANVLLEQGEAEEAIRIYERLSVLCPDNLAFRINRALTLPVLYASREEIVRWRQRCEAEVDALLRADLPPADAHFSEQLVSTGFYLGYHGLADKDLQVKIARLLRKALGLSDAPAPRELSLRSLSGETLRFGGKARIGFISRHLSHKHTIGKLLQGVILNLSRELFEVHVFSVGSETAWSPTGREHPEDRFYELPIRDFEACRRILANAGLDILYFTDIGMDVPTCLLAQYRFAPVQCVTWGHPVTTGSPNIDYFISSQYVETPESPAHYTETLVPLENYPFHYERPHLEALTLSREALAVGPEEHLYACVQSLFKLHPDTDILFGEILRRDPHGVLLLLSHPSEKCNRRFYERFARSYPDVAERVRFVPRLPRHDFLSLLAIADVLLDSIHFSGGNTSYEALAFGTPVITLNTPYMKGRLTLGLYKRLGLMDAVAATPEEYIALAVRYGTDPAARTRLREEILAHCPVLYADEAPVRELEAFLLGALRDCR